MREDNETVQETSDQVLKILTEDAREGRVKKHQNQIKLILQNQINPIANYCLDLDAKKEGVFSKEKYKKLLEKINVPEHIITIEDRENIFEQFKDSNSNFNYKDFITQIKNFNYRADEAYVIS